MISINRLTRIAVVIIFLIMIILASFFIVRRAFSENEYGDAQALCPGPDLYGYTCEGGTAFSYIDATYDTFLYELDGVTEINIPFPFTFYGTTYTSLFASSNGNLQFGDGNPYFFNSCLVDGSAQDMGELIAPYWDDLDLRVSGYLETAVIGTEPNRIFVIEWDDIPHFGNDEDRVTFEVQLFESSNDILFLYEDVTSFEGNNGSSATIGLQSAGHDLGLQFSCNQPAIANATQFRFPHPENSNPAIGSLETAVIPNTTSPQTNRTIRPETAAWLQQINLHGARHLATLQQDWLTQFPALRSQWRHADLLGNGLDEIIIVRYGTKSASSQTEIVILAQESPNANYTVQHQAHLSNRTQPIPTLTIADTGDVTADGIADAILTDPISGTTFVATAVSGNLQLIQLDELCVGKIALKDDDGNGRVDIIRNNCPNQQTIHLEWNGTQFQPK